MPALWRRCGTATIVAAMASATPMPTARYALGVAVLNGVLYAVGGYNTGYLATVEAYQP